MEKIALTLGIIGSLILFAFGCSGTLDTNTPATNSTTNTENVPAAY
jgi:hypothetical protein